MYYLILIPILISTSTVILGAPTETAKEILALWSQAEQTPNYKTQKGWSDVLRRDIPKGDRTALAQLLEIIKNNRRSLPTRALAMGVVAAIADESSALSVIELLSDFRAGKLAPPELTDEDVRREVHMSQLLRVREFIRNDMHYLVETMQDDTPIFLFLVDCFRGVVLGMQSHVARLIAECNVATELRRDAIVGIIENHHKRNGAVRIELIELLDEDAFPRLRSLVRASQSRRDFHFGAAYALSCLGDEEIVADLEKMYKVFHAHGGTAESFIVLDIWRIQIQHPPEKLLDYIASVDRKGERETRSWAVRKAHKLGLASELIRKAILEHAKKGTTRIERMELPELKRLGIELGILLESDLPGVEIRKRKVTH